MFKGHPKGLYVAFFANMGERFGFYTMMACLVFFLQAKFGLTADEAGGHYSNFYFAIYALALVGGILADKTKKYKAVIFVGILIMLGGYILMATPGLNLTITLVALYIIALGNGLFKGNLQAIVGQLYDDPKYDKLRDSAFSIFYMGINMGALVAPHAANGIRNWLLGTKGYTYDADLPALCHQLLDNTITNTATLQELANKVTGTEVANLSSFAIDYLQVFSTGYNYAFGVAAFSMVISLLVYVFFQKMLPNGSQSKEALEEKENATVQAPSNPMHLVISLAIGAAIALGIYFVKDLYSGLAIGLFAGFVSWISLSSTKEEKPKVTSLLLVFGVVIFFWMSFHQNGLTLSFFARDYTAKSVGAFTYLFFDFWGMIAVLGTIISISTFLGKDASKKTKTISGIVALVAISAAIFRYTNVPKSNPIEPEIFQSFNPIFIVVLTPLILGLFAWLRSRKMEPSTPKKIGIGMILAAVGFMIMVWGSLSLISPADLGGAPSPDRASPYWLINTYLVLTFAELFLSPMGISFVSKVSPRRFQGIMQGGWLLATAVGNKLLFVGSFMWDKIEIWQIWSIFIICCVISATFIFSIMKRLEKATD
ncbi:MAG: peptide MFS transporter [Salinivirgaceae bacterium]|nr:peptide MFS transporter [Salinivirgaceae bacterium]